MADFHFTTLNGVVPDQLPVLSRPREGAVIGGVCAGLAHRMGIEPKVLRIIAVVAAVAFGGLGVALYGAGLLLIPRQGEQYGPLTRAVPALRSWPKGALIGVVIIAAVALTWGTGGGPVLVAAAAIGLVLWFGVFRHRPNHSVTRPPEPTPFERAADAWRVRLGEQQIPGFENAVAEQRWQQPYTDASDQLVSDSPPQLPAVLPKRSWRLWGLALALSGVGIAIVAAVGFGTGSVALPYLAAVLAALGITGLVAARYGRPPLLVPATILTAVAMVFQLVPNPGPMGQVDRTITDQSQLAPSYELAAGEVDLDLSQLVLTEDRQVSIKVGTGEVLVKLPKTVTSELSWKVGAGDATLPNDGGSGLSLSGSQVIGAGGAGPTLRLLIDVGAGDLEVTQ